LLLSALKKRTRRRVLCGVTAMMKKKSESSRKDSLRAVAKFTSRGGLLAAAEIDEILEGAADLGSFEQRADEKRLPLESVVKALKRDRKI
jgi:hypothetical protein